MTWKQHIFNMHAAIQLGDVAALRRLKQPTDTFPKKELILAAELDQVECVEELLTWCETQHKGLFYLFGLQAAARDGRMGVLRAIHAYMQAHPNVLVQLDSEEKGVKTTLVVEDMAKIWRNTLLTAI